MPLAFIMWVDDVPTRVDITTEADGWRVKTLDFEQFVPNAAAPFPPTPSISKAVKSIRNAAYKIRETLARR